MKALLIKIAGILPVVAAMVLTPILVQLLGWAFPPDKGRMFESFERLSARNRWIDVVSSAATMCAMVALLGLLLGSIEDLGLPAISLLFGVIPTAYYLAAGMVTLPQGISRWREFWRYYVRSYGIGLAGLVTMSLMCWTAGAVSVAVLFARGVWSL